MRVKVLGIGMGPQHVTPEVAGELRSCDYVVAARKRVDDRLLEVRRAVCEQYGVPLVEFDDPQRDRDTVPGNGPAHYADAVRDWHEARVRSYESVLRERGGTAGLLVWGDPSLYDSAIRVVERLAARNDLDWDVVPGISAPQVLAARHRVVLHEVGRPVHLTTARRLREDIAAGQTNLVVMLGGALALDGLEDWSIWWGANLGTDSEELVAGRVGDRLGELAAARARARAAAGWVMDIYLLRGPG
ncbi:precorrin-6A synthase (deacetylating) [Nocardioides terrisoli]|uniref:precorrin-6A synthase (deacetylating) n=1 Tax=Nocardioides terrisoli TaxID=3388267 RepID=UPI00287BA5BE|nr:precorrin-6A synthase (deacetylating) [Nocardioides marmorisolisilvae]